MQRCELTTPAELPGGPTTGDDVEREFRRSRVADADVTPDSHNVRAVKYVVRS